MKKINLKGYFGFVLDSNDISVEANRLRIFCLLNDIKLLLTHDKKYIENYIPCGSVEWCENILGYHVKPDYYPEWLSEYFHRKIWKYYKQILGKKLFVKPSDRYKRFTGFITTGTYSKKKKSPLIWSEIVHFENEWRYYISNGKILCSSWYWNNGFYKAGTIGDIDVFKCSEIEPDAPKLKINIPKNYSGSIDFGTLRDGKLALIEAQHPFACGWYGEQKNDYIYFQWLVDGWIYMKNLF